MEYDTLVETLTASYVRDQQRLILSRRANVWVNEIIRKEILSEDNLPNNCETYTWEVYPNLTPPSLEMIKTIFEDRGFTVVEIDSKFWTISWSKK